MYNVTLQKNMDLSHEQAGNLIAQVLKEDFEFISKEISELTYRLTALRSH